MKKILSVCAIVAITGCNGGGTTGSGGFSSLVGPTSFFGLWQVTATINVIIGGTTTNISHTSTLDIQPSGAVTIRSTDADCAISVFANGATLTYQEECTLAAENAPCVIQFPTNAMFIVDNISGTFGPQSFVCVGSSTSFSGNFVGARVVPDDVNDNNDNGNTNDNTNTNDNDNTNTNGNTNTT